MTGVPTPRAIARSAPVRAVRRVLAPAALQLADQLPGLLAELAELRERVVELRVENEALRGRLEGVHAPTQLRSDLDAVRDELREVRGGLHQERRLQLRVAELVDLVSELVLPLHDREIDPGVIGRLRSDAS